MEIAIQAIGDYLKLDNLGYIINPARLEHLPEYGSVLVETIQEAYLKAYGNDLHSIYLRGSLVRGSFVPGISDIDAIGLLQNKGVRWKSAPFQKEIQSTLEKIIRGQVQIDARCSSYDEKMLITYPELAMILKTQAIAIFGTDIRTEIPKYRIDRSLLLHYRWLEEDLKHFFNKTINNAQDRKAIHKMLIRCGLEVVLERCQQFSFDLYPAIQLFGRIYPEKKAEMEQILYYFLNPDLDIEAQLRLIEKLGNWLIEEINAHIL